MAKAKSKTIYTCQKCGAQRPRWEGRCSECLAWNTLVEEIQIHSQDLGRGWAVSSRDEMGSTQVVALDQDITETKVERHSTNISELDRVLGGGLVPGSFILLGGDPGIGKSTLLMQMAGGITKFKGTVLYVSAEESVNQTALRAQRLGVKSAQVLMAAESNLDSIITLAKSQKPNVLIVDSIQTVFIPSLQSAPGSVAQVRESAGQLMALAKNMGITVLLIGHVTKDGNIAGPKVLEHMVDTVLSFEGDSSQQFRLLRSLKNRFGATFELGVFQMSAQGLVEVSNPSELFLEERGDSLIGSAVFASVEGTRPLLCEIQALTARSPMAMPRRTSIGFDNQRVHLLSAVLDKHASTDLVHQDVFVNVVGGLKIEEPAADLAVAAALLSSEGSMQIDPQMVFVGEVGLTGEVRAVPFFDLRVREAAKLGFTKVVGPYSNKKHFKQSDFKDIEVHWIRSTRELCRYLNPTQKSKGAIPAPMFNSEL